MIIRKIFYVTAFTIVTVMLLVLGTGIRLAAFDLPTQTPTLESLDAKATADEATLLFQATHVLDIVTAQAAETATASASVFPSAWDPLESTCRHASLSIL